MKVQHKKFTSWQWRLLIRLWDFRMPISVRSLLDAEQKSTIKSLLKDGDILLESNNVYPLSQVITKILDGSDWIHSAIYVGDDQVIDAGRKACVARIKLDKFLLTTDVAIYRPNYHCSDDLSALLSFAKNSVGAPFNLNFDDTDEHSFYCTQLISQHYSRCPILFAWNTGHIPGKQRSYIVG